MAIVLWIEWEDRSRNSSLAYLRSRGHIVAGAKGVCQALGTLRHVRPDVIIVDADVAELSPDELRQWVRADDALEETPIIYLVPEAMRWMIAAVVRSKETYRGFVVGKPFSWQEMDSQVQQAVSLSTSKASALEAIIAFGPLTLNKNSYELSGDKGKAILTPTELKLLTHLIERAGSAQRSDSLLRQIWGYTSSVGSSDVVRAHIRNLRRKIVQVTSHPDVIKTLPRRGYRLDLGPTNST